MTKNRILIITLGAIVLLNIIAILFISNKIANDKLSDSTINNINQLQGTVNIPSNSQSPDGTNLPTTENNLPSRVVIRNQPLVKTYIMKATCKDCSDLYDITKYLVVLNETINMNISYVTQEEIGITPERLPALFFNESIINYPTIIQDWQNNGVIVNSTNSGYLGTWYVLPVIHAPFYDTKDNVVRGRVSVTYLMKSSCKGCMDVPSLQNEIKSTGINPYHEQIVDTDSEQGKLIVKKYNITAVPTILLDNQALFHAQLFPNWYSVGTVELDGTMILRNLNRMRVTYYDLKRDQLMIP